MRTAQGGAAGAKIQHPLTSAYGTKREFSPERLKGRKPADCRPSPLKVGFPADGRPDSEGSRRSPYDPKAAFSLFQ